MMNEATTKRFYAFLADYLRNKCKLKVKEVQDAKEVQESTGYCETCYDVWTEVNIHYTDLDGVSKIYRFDGSMSDIFVL